jgi:hypothetical protein
MSGKQSIAVPLKAFARIGHGHSLIAASLLGV